MFVIKRGSLEWVSAKIESHDVICDFEWVSVELESNDVIIM